MFAERRTIELRQKIAGLDTEFNAWRDASLENQFFEKHHTQILAVSNRLIGLRTRLEQEFEDAVKAGSVLAEARNLEAMVLAVRRIWEYFRAKWVQRREAKFSPFLHAADELAWSCYKPVLDHLEPDRLSPKRREPPLVFLNGGTSPFALARDRGFDPEPVAQEYLSDRELKSVLEHLPVPVIGVPWFHLAHFAEATVITHETGHIVERDFGLFDGLVANVKDAVPADRQDAWSAWSREAFADLFGCLTLGAAYAGTLMDFLAAEPSAVREEVADPAGKYPPTRVRVRLCIAALLVAGFKADARPLLKRWSGSYGAASASSFEQDALPVARNVLCTPIAPLAIPLRAVANLAVRADDYRDARAGMADRLREPEARPPKAVITIRQFFILARLLYDRDPQAYFSKDHTKALLDFLPTIIKPGVRAGESRPSTKDIAALELQQQKDGEAWFESMRALWLEE
jgi:hypothetical protein